MPDGEHVSWEHHSSPRRAPKTMQVHRGGFSHATTPQIFITSFSKVSSWVVKLLMSRAGYQRLNSTRHRMMGM